jgi:hypothetical protein
MQLLTLNICTFLLIISPGDQLKPGESEIEGVTRCLTQKLAPPGTLVSDGGWEVGELLTVWWRPNFETFMVWSSNLLHMSVVICTFALRNSPFSIIR